MKKEKIKKYIFSNTNKIKINSNDIEKGDIFIALQGKNFHGINFAAEALAKGADYVLTDKVIQLNNNKSIIKVDHILNFLTNIANEKRNLFSGKVIGITGSIGKTSVKDTLKYLLESSFNISVSIKSYNNFLGVIISLLNLNLDSDYGIFELGTNNFNEIKYLTSIIRPSQVIITNIYPSHLEKLINTKNIAKEKSDIFNPKYNKYTEVAFLPNDNKDEKSIIKIAKSNHLFKIITFGKSSKSDIRIKEIKFFDQNNSKIFIQYKNKIFSMLINNNQVPRINNILICFGLFIYNNINLELFNSLLKRIPLISGRGLQQKISINNMIINFIDESYNASPQSMRVTIDYFIDLKFSSSQKKFLILGDMQELGKDTIKYHKNLLSYVCSKKIENIIICGELMKIALDKKMKKKLILISDKNLILDYLNNNLSNNDIILIKGSNSSITNDLSRELLKRRVY